jgi:hypothetical protein
LGLPAPLDSVQMIHSKDASAHPKQDAELRRPRLTHNLLTVLLQFEKLFVASTGSACHGKAMNISTHYILHNSKPQLSTLPPFAASH